MVQQETPDSVRAREVARSEFDAWIASASQPEAARRSIAPDAALRSTTLARVEAVLSHPRCGAANRRWICELTRAWAPLEVLFPTHDYRGMRGVSGELPLHVALLVEREYGHILGVARSLPAAYDLLRQDRDRLALQLAIATALLPHLSDAGADAKAEDVTWLAELKQMSLAMAEYLHRHAIGLSQILPDAMVMTYTAAIARTQRVQRSACQAGA